MIYYNVLQNNNIITKYMTPVAARHAAHIDHIMIILKIMVIVFYFNLSIWTQQSR